MAGGDAATALLESGLRLYGDGDLLGALAEWEAALRVDPQLERAREYIDYVRANFDALTEQFDAARDVEAAASAQGVPVIEVPDDPDAYDSIDVEVAAPSDDEQAGEADADLQVGLAALDEELNRALEDDTPAPGDLQFDDVVDFVEVVGVDEGGEGGEAADEEPQAVEIEAMAPDEDMPGIAPDLEDDQGMPGLVDLPAQRGDIVSGDLGEPLDDEATVDRRMHELLSRSSSPPATADLPPAGVRPGIMTIQPRAARGEPPTEDSYAGPPPLGLGMPLAPDAHSPLEPGAYDNTPPAGTEAARLVPAAGSPESDDDSDVEAEATRAYERRHGGIVVTPYRGAPPSHDFDEPEVTTDFDDRSLTRERRPFRAARRAHDEGTEPGDEAAREPSVPGEPMPDSSVIIDERLLRGAGLLSGTGHGPDPDRTVDFVPHRDPIHDARTAEIYARVTDLLHVAREAADGGDYLNAVLAVEEAVATDADGAIAPVLLHRHRDLVYRIYEGHIGDIHAVPFIAVHMQEIAASALDHRTGFLLSRIDGMLTFEDILDVAGMPRMEAYQILSRLLRKGVIEARR